MKNLKLLTACLLASTFFCKAQSPQNFDQLKPVANPAYILLGVSPTNIERPTTPKEFIAGIQNATVNGKLAPNFAMELTPYELLTKNRKKDYTFKAIDYILNKDWATNFARSIAVSFATSATDTVALGSFKKGTSAAVGVKMLFIHGKPKKQTVEALVKLTNAFEAKNSLGMVVTLLDAYSQNANISLETAQKNIDDALNAFTSFINDSPELSEKDKSIKIAAAKAKFKFLREDINDIAKKDSISVSKMKELVEAERKEYIAIQGENLKMVNSKFAFSREGFMLEGNIGVLTHFQNNSRDSAMYAKIGVWLTPSYKWNLATSDNSGSASVDAIGLVRYTGNDIKVDSSSYIDIGAKLQFNYNKISFSGEYIYRLLTQKPTSIHYDFTDRITGNLEYVVNNLITLKASVGRTFDGNSAVYDQPNNKIFAIGGINFSVLNGQ